MVLDPRGLGADPRGLGVEPDRLKLAAPLLLPPLHNPPQTPLQPHRQREPIIHITRLLKPARALEPALGPVVLRPRDPSDAVVVVERHAGGALVGRDDLHAVFVDEDGGGAALAGVGLHRLFERGDGGGAGGRFVSTRK